MVTNTVSEPERTVKVAGEFDVIVCGGGPAGFAAAFSAAKRGAKTLLLERGGCLGGIWSAGLMPWIIDQRHKIGVMARLRTEIFRRGGIVSSAGSLGVPPETLKYLLEELLLSSGAHLRYGTLATAALRKDGRLTHVVTESKSGREAWAGKIFIDCTGDGDLAAFAGCEFEYAGDDGRAQPSSLNALVGGLELEQVESYLADSGGKPRLLADLRRAGIDPSYSEPSLFHYGCGIFGLMAHHGYRTCAFDASSITREILEGRIEIQRQVSALRALGGVWRNLALLATGEQLGVREGRRIRGVDRISVATMTGGVNVEQPVCRVEVGPDLHAPNPEHCRDVLPATVRISGGYPIPWGALLSADCENLLLAGRCVSGDFVAHSSYRVSGNAVPMGEAAGFGGAEAAETGVSPRELHDIPFLSESDSK